MSPTEKLFVDPGVGTPDGDTEVERMVCVRGMSRGAGLLPLPCVVDDSGDAEGCESADGVLGEILELEAGEPSGGCEPLPLSTTAPSGSVTLTCIDDSRSLDFERGLDLGRCCAEARERLPCGVLSLESRIAGSGGVDDSAAASFSFKLSLPLFFDFLDCGWPMGRPWGKAEGEPG